MVMEESTEVFPFLICILHIRKVGKSDDFAKNILTIESSKLEIDFPVATELESIADVSDIRCESNSLQIKENTRCRAIFNLKTCRDSSRSLIRGNSLRIYNSIMIPPASILAEGPCGLSGAQMLPLLICTHLSEAISDDFGTE